MKAIDFDGNLLGATTGLDVAVGTMLSIDCRQARQCMSLLACTSAFSLLQGHPDGGVE